MYNSTAFCDFIFFSNHEFKSNFRKKFKMLKWYFQHDFPLASDLNDFFLKSNTFQQSWKRGKRIRSNQIYRFVSIFSRVGSVITLRLDPGFPRGSDHDPGQLTGGSATPGENPIAEDIWEGNIIFFQGRKVKGTPGH